MQRAVGRLHAFDCRWQVLLASRIQQQHARPQWPDEFTGRIDRLNVSKRGFAIQGLADLLEQRVIAGQGDDFDARWVRDVRLAQRMRVIGCA